MQYLRWMKFTPTRLLSFFYGIYTRLFEFLRFILILNRWRQFFQLITYNFIRNINSMMTLMKGFLGTGSLALPFAFSQAGYLVGSNFLSFRKLEASIYLYPMYIVCVPLSYLWHAPVTYAYHYIWKYKPIFPHFSTVHLVTISSIFALGPCISMFLLIFVRVLWPMLF